MIGCAQTIALFSRSELLITSVIWENAGAVLPVTGSGPRCAQLRPEQAACGCGAGKEDCRWTFYCYCGRYRGRRTGVPAGQLAAVLCSSSSSSTTDWCLVSANTTVMHEC
jgi:hypothetical protein